MTLTGLVVAPLALLIIFLPWRYGITMLFVLATLDGAAVVNVGSFGLQPSYFLGLLMIGRTIVEIGLAQDSLNALVLRRMIPLGLFAVICFLSIWIGLSFFQGRIMVVSSTVGLNLDLAQPYTFQRQNLTQPFYLLLNVLLVYALAHQLARLPAATLIRTIDGAVVGAVLFASAVALWEMAHFYAAVPFPDPLFHSNAGYISAYRQVLPGGILRASGPFAEPSALSYYFAGSLFYAWYRYLNQPGVGFMAVVLLCLAIMALSTSTTAFIFIGFFAIIVFKDMVLVAVQSKGRVTLSSHQLATVAVIALAGIVTAAFLQIYWHSVDEVLRLMLFEKGQSSSFAERTGVDMIAFDIVLQSGGIGLGLGSHKPNNLVMTLLSNTGLAGSLVFGLFLFDLLRPRMGTARHDELKPLRWLVIGLLLVHATSNPNLSSIILWIGFALIIGLLAAPDAAAPRPVAARSRAAAADDASSFRGDLRSAKRD